MRKLSLKEYLAILIFFLTIGLGSLIAFPVYKKVTSSLKEVSQNVFELITEKTGLVVSYKKMSPSVFSGLNVKKIMVNTSDSGEKLCEIKKLNIRYNLFALLKGNALKAVDNVILDGFVLDMDNSNYLSLMEKLGLLQSEGESEPGQNNQEKKNKSLALGKITTEIPFNVFFKNVYVNFENETQTFSGHLKKLTLAFLKTQKTLVVDTSGKLVMYNNGEPEKKYSANFSSQGNLPQKLNGSSLIFRLSDISNGSYSINKLNLLFGYNEDIFDLRTIQNGYPLLIHASYGLKSHEGNLEINTKNLKPGALISSRRGDKSIRKIRNLRINLSLNAYCDNKNSKFKYNSDGSIYVPDSIFHGGFNASYSIRGDNNKLNLNRFALKGPNVDAVAEFSYLFKTMRMNGSASLNQFVLPNGSNISTEVFFEPLSKGFVAFAPNLLLDEKALTGIQLSMIPVKDSVDFSFELSDYFHVSEGHIGKLKLGGSYIGGTNYIQANLETNALFLDSLAQTAMTFIHKKNEKVSSFSFLSNYMLNGEAFFSTDFKSLSFNVPYLFAANTKKDDQLLYLSLDGNNESVNVSKFDFINNGKSTHLEAQYEKAPDSNDAFFVVEVNADSIPYSFTGNIMSDSISVSGDYGLAFDLFKTGLSRYDGTFSMVEFPLPIGGMVLSLNTDTAFSFNSDDGISANIAKLEVNEVSGKFVFDPHFYLSAELNKYGLSLKNITYADIYSILSGTGQGAWNLSDKGLENMSFDLAVKSDTSKEAIDLNAELSSSEEGEMFVNAKVLFNVFGLNRFTAETSENNTLTASLVATGPLSNPFIGINLDNFSLMKAGSVISASGNAFVEEKVCNIDNINLKYNDFYLKKVNASFSLDDFCGKLTAELSGNVMDKNIFLPLQFTISDTSKEEGKLIPTDFVANLTCSKVDGTLFARKFPLSVTFVHSNKDTLLYTGPEQGIQGTISSDGSIHMGINKGKPLDFDFSGSVKGNLLNLSLQGVKADVAEIFSYLDIPMLRIYGGILKGSLKITGITADPEFTGAFSLTGADFTLPTIVPSHITVPKAILTANHNKFIMPEVQGLIKKQTPIYADLDITMDRWALGLLKSHIWIPKNVYGPGDFDIGIARFTGDANIDLMLTFEDNILDCSGDVNVKNIDARVITKELAKAVKFDMPLRCAVKLGIGPHVNFRFDPLLRAVFVPDSEFSVSMDTTDGSFKLDGEIALRSGDISYLNRSFYLKKGIMRFNANDPTFNPLITVQAETRERDDAGNDIRIILSANNQYLLNFNPQFSSIPARSETEIKTMLGQIALGDSDNVSSLLLSAGDYAVQSFIGRNIENKLREFLNFDILSIRTNVLQNALKQGLSNGLSFSAVNSVGIGNFLDNSTVYIGKYFGSDLYVDALMHWTYDDTRVGDTLTIGGLVFKPELGFELTSPFVNIRWSMAPDIDAIMNSRIVSSTSVTLSWNFSF